MTRPVEIEAYIDPADRASHASKLTMHRSLLIAPEIFQISLSNKEGCHVISIFRHLSSHNI
jgi:hypothetical protein